nr:MAG TPA_asm: hypothetical protein [Caudoviricetes sp.]
MRGGSGRSRGLRPHGASAGREGRPHVRRRCRPNRP